MKNSEAKANITQVFIERNSCILHNKYLFTTKT